MSYTFWKETGNAEPKKSKNWTVFKNSHKLFTYKVFESGILKHSWICKALIINIKWKHFIQERRIILNKEEKGRLSKLLKSFSLKLVTAKY